jgi:hypothetical protein
MNRLQRQQDEPHDHTYNGGQAFFYTGGEDVYLMVACDYRMKDGMACGELKMLKGAPLIYG